MILYLVVVLLSGCWNAKKSPILSNETGDVLVVNVHFLNSSTERNYLDDKMEVVLANILNEEQGLTEIKLVSDDGQVIVLSKEELISNMNEDKNLYVIHEGLIIDLISR